MPVSPRVKLTGWRSCIVYGARGRASSIKLRKHDPNQFLRADCGLSYL